MPTIAAVDYVRNYKHFLWTMDGPHSSYSCLVIHICWKVEREDKMEPPIQTEYFLSGGAMILILMVDGAKAVISFCIRSAIPGYVVGDTISRVHDHTGGTTGGIQGEDSLDGNIHGGHVEGLEHDLSHLLTVSLGVKGSLSQENGLLLWGNTEFTVEGVMPDLLHIIPVGDDTVFNGVFQGKDTSLGLSFISNIGILLSHTDHDTLMTRASNNGREDSPGGIISSESGLAHARAIVYDKSGGIFVTHVCF